MRIALVLLVVAVVVYVVVRFVQSRYDQDTREVGRAPARPDPGAEEAYRRAVRERAERQRRGVPKPDQGPAAPAEPTVVVEPEVFGHDRDFGTCHEAFVVESTSPPVDVIAAVRRANARFMLVDELGREHASGDALDAAFDAHEGPDDLYTPNYAADPKITPKGVEGYLDCKGGIEPAMGVTLRRVLLEELSRLDRPARVRPRSDG